MSKITIVGSGNVAFQMGLKLQSAGLEIHHVISRNTETGSVLADILDAQFSEEFDCSGFENDIFILAVKDSAIEEVSAKLRCPGSLHIHTSGSRPLDVLDSENKGVIWPLYSISMEKKIRWEEVPLIIESSDSFSDEKVKRLCEALDGPTYELKSDQRAFAHMMAVFINNFTTHYFDLLENSQRELHIDPHMFDAILHQTFSEIKKGFLSEKLTGPAKRNDTGTMDQHKRIIANNPVLLEIYKLYSQSIIDKYHGEEL